MKIRNWATLTFVFTLLVVVGAWPVAVQAETPTLEEIAAAFEAVWNEGDVDALDAIATPNIVVHDPPDPDIVGLDAYKSAVIDARNGVPDAYLLFEEAGVVNDRIYARWMYGGTHTGESESMGPPTGRPFTITGATVARFVGSKLVEMWHNADDLGMMMQLGMELAPVNAPAAWEMEPHGLRPDAPTYAVRGPYAVGVRNFEIPATQENERDLAVTVWYPALNPEGVEEAYVYTMAFEAGDMPTFSTGGRAIGDAAAATSAGPYPLVVHSHGHWAFGQELNHLAEHLASHGFVVLATDHEDNWTTAWGPKSWQSEFRRPDEIRRQIDFAEAISAEGADLEAMVDLDHVAVTGWSYGGETALLEAGARLDPTDFDDWCKANIADGEYPDSDCISVLDHLDELAEMAGLDEIPDGLWPVWADPRVDASVALAPSVGMIGSNGMQAVDRPAMLIVGSDDMIIGSAYQEQDPYTLIEDTAKVEVVFEGADHFIFRNKCDATPDLVDMDLHLLCSDPIWDMDRAHDLTNHFVTAFMLAELKGDLAAAAALAPESVDFPGIEYQAEGYDVAGANLDPELAANIETYIEEAMDENEITGLGIGIVQDGQLAYANGFGTTSVENGEAVTPQTLFQLAEVSMTPTTMAVLQLVEAGRIDLDAPLTDYLPYFEMADPAFADITVRQVLLHTSGIPDSGDTAADWSVFVPEFDEEAVERMVRGLSDRELLFAPDEGWEYSDVAFMVLGDLIAKVSGQPYETYMAEQLFAPLGMEASTFLLEEIDPMALAKPIVLSDDGPIVSDVFPYSRQFAASNNLFSNVEDMAGLIQASLNRGELNGTRILSAETYDLMWMPSNETPYGAPWSYWGMGWIVTEVGGCPVVWMGGADMGFEADAMLCPDENLAVIVLSNGPNSGDYYTPFMTADLMEMIFDQKPGR